MTSSRSRRALLTSALAGAGLVAIDRVQEPASFRRNIGAIQVRSTARPPLFVAMLDRHANRLAPLLPEIEASINRRLEIDALSADDLYAWYTIDLLQQTGRYDVVSMVDAWTPYFGRRGYLANVPDLDQDAGARYPRIIGQAAQGIDGTAFVAYPWTFDHTCCVWNSALDHRIDFGTWSSFFQSAPDDGGIPVSMGLRVPESAALAYRNALLSFGDDLVRTESNQPDLTSYSATRALEIVKRLANRTGVEASLGEDGSGAASSLAAGQAQIGIFLPASDTRQIWPSPTWRVAHVPSGRDGSGVTDLSVWLLGVPGGAPNVDAARDFVSALSAPEMQSRLWPDAGLLPVTSAVLAGDWAPNAAAMEVAVNLALYRARLRPRLRSFRSLMDICGRMVQSAVRDGQPVPDLLTAAQSSALAVLQEENELSS